MKKKIMFISMILIILLFTGLDEETYSNKLNELNNELIKKGVPEDWLSENVNNDKFEIYYNIDKLFNKMAEHQVKNNEKDFEWYKNQFGAEEKITLGKIFIKNNLNKLEKVEKIHGIHYELIAAIYGMETNYGDTRFLGKFYIFSALISQYLLSETTKKYAANELYNLYLFSQKIKKPVYYFKGSYSGACGFGQFIPSSLYNYFVDSNDNVNDIDIYSVDDTITSIDNYLYKNRLNKWNVENEEGRYRAVYSYNHSPSYVKLVLMIYDELRLLRKK